ncbi:peptidase M43 [bacterium (Candidatus Blackallbacteria) CG17_big_fil_post_rev_8_21_14_2_50_48_46]|uniref:Peptidase M43 n=1 Tax=bacterium (Candidatus Blackallbacteria) CG17_big_fil_post_rev_8_21_14_2_50_48_46 TaxID=2014261 RepID=A0A2M7G6S2_9BACT|nr:MAG: peptidase M43 [bacterium (Candidatus Blackallbacteria) CG18_big_fil_WC_8_21_14_2_50_49_26]PIW17735.1 MAG: peptidase M43 [bacterium (Candidatus Blackallbacteria) CG17_big_fil_post_rev_8_21_14_2_50_48_46]PIW47763.1 MAG: peptidase M43 [bacterium (Candidatus Blackallbacteria) CG13_big_fil_rev_8_21_14_2_50_49_14]
MLQRRLSLLTLLPLLSLSLWLSPACQVSAQASPNQAGEENAPSFEKTIKGFTALPGLFTFYLKESDHKILLEIQPAQLDQVFLLSITREAGDGAFFDSSSQENTLPVYFHKVGKTIQLLVKNYNYRADQNTAIQRAIPRGVSDALLGSTQVIGPPHPEKGALLVDAAELFVSDLANTGRFFQMLQREGLASYRLDERNSYLQKIKSFPENNEIEVLLNYLGEGTDFPTPTLADDRGFRHLMHYSLSKLPETSYQPRLADDRVGHFTTMYWDYNQFSKEDPYVRYINRWNLEKADPRLPLSPPREPIVFWLENTIPTEYRDAVREGVLLWNTAFEKIGFKDAIQVKQMPDDADWDPADARYNTIRWMVNPGASYAVGPSRAHPLTGEVYDADVRISADFIRAMYNEYDFWATPLAEAPKAQNQTKARKNSQQRCEYSQGLAHELSFGRQLMAARGSLSPAASAQFIHDAIIALVAHEVGHTLGLRHNFKASTLHKASDLHLLNQTRSKGLTSSVMDYVPVNLAPKGVKQGEYYQTTLGPYDYWAIEYAYRQFTKDSDLSEKGQLEKIAARSSQPELAYGTDEDVYGGPLSVDPLANFWDLGADPLLFQRQRLELAQELFSKLEKEFEKPGERYPRLRQVFSMALSEYFVSVQGIVKYVGGIYTHRNHIGDPQARVPLEVVPAAKQREALELVATQLFNQEAFQFSPELLSKMGPERQWDFEDSLLDSSLDLPLHQIVKSLHSRVLGYLLSSPLLNRIQDNELLFKKGEARFTLEQHFSFLRDSIWKELKQGQNIVSFRRNLQRIHLEQLKQIYLNRNLFLSADARTLARQDLIQLRQGIDQALKVSGVKLDALTRAHLDESRAIMDTTIKASIAR